VIVAEAGLEPVAVADAVVPDASAGSVVVAGAATTVVGEVPRASAPA
jgi:hypothetical protein